MRYTKYSPGKLRRALIRYGVNIQYIYMYVYVYIDAHVYIDILDPIYDLYDQQLAT